MSMSPTKMVLRSTLALIAIAAIALLFFAVGLEDIVKRVIENVASEQTGTKVTLDHVELDLPSGQGMLLNLRISNPDGYPEGSALALGQVALQIDPASLARDVYVIEKASLESGAVFVYPQQKTTNLTVIMAHMNAVSGGATATSADSDQSDQEPRLALERLSITGIEIFLYSQSGDQKSIRLPDYVQTGIGNLNSGLTATQMSHAVIHEIFKRAENAVLLELRRAVENEARKKMAEELGQDNTEILHGLNSVMSKKN